jgi:hypothetical protein
MINIKVRNPENKGPIWRPAGRWEDNIRMGLGEMACGGVDWI